MDNLEPSQVSETVEATPSVASDQSKPRKPRTPRKPRKSNTALPEPTHSEAPKPSTGYPLGIRIIDN